ncbi:CHAD domain-containing protein [Anderseniella sp. Alg231-50]|uniref:CHAD domain-containing protein n=1 Tax=Anderseniella sp. Alg231-50 TaxID=1922226 RepID=UPI000D54CCF3
MTVQIQAAGNAVTGPAELQARKPTRIRLAPAMTGAGMISVIANENLADLRHNLQVFMITGSVGSVHKSRVSARRLRVFLKGIRAWMQPETYKPLATNLKLAMAILHPLRQHDVVTHWLAAAGAETHDARHDRLTMVRDAQAQLSNAAMIGFVDEFAKLMQAEHWRRRDTEVLDQPCLCIVPGIVEQTVQKLNRAGSLEQVFETTGDYHAFRKDLKRLRYWLEFTRSLFAKRDIAPWRKTAKLLQTRLGTINDLDEARMTGHDRLVGADAWGARRSEAVDLAVSLSDTLNLLPRFWR